MEQTQQVFCMQCGQKITADATFCTSCGAAQTQSKPNNNNSHSPNETLPDGIRGWSWGAFWLTWIWAIFNKTWIGLLALIPVVNFGMMVVLGLKGREWAWKNKHWNSVDDFNRVQKKWNLASWILLAVGLLIGIATAVIEERMSQDADWDLSTSESSAKEDEHSLDLPKEKVKASSSSDSPYPQPQLAFSKIDFLKALKAIGTELHWEAEFTNYLSSPQKFWSDCVASNAGWAQIQGGQSPSEAQAYGLDICQSTTETYYQCLNNKSLDDAVMCLQQHINDIAENGD